jgi:hypothetical protein
MTVEGSVLLEKHGAMRFEAIHLVAGCEEALMM